MNHQEFESELFRRFCQSVRLSLGVQLSYFTKRNYSAYEKEHQFITGYGRSVVYNFNLDSPFQERARAIYKILQSYPYQSEFLFDFISRLRNIIILYEKDYQRELAA